MWAIVKSAFSAFGVAVSDTFGCTGGSGNAIDDDDDNNYVADHNDAGASSQPAFVEIDLLRSDLNRQRRFPDNSIRTAKYTLASGLPLSLLYQFYKISNFYFLLVMVISLVPGASPINPFSSVVPLCIVLGAGVIKDLWEDWKRRKADKQANEMIVHVLRVSTQLDQTSRRAHGTAPPGTTTSTSEADRNSSSPKDFRRRAAQFLFSSDISRSKRSVEVGEATASPRRAIEMSSMYQGSLSNPQQQTQPSSPIIAGSNAQTDDAGRREPAQPVLLKRAAQREKSSNAALPPPSSAANTATPSSHEPKITFQPIRSCDVYPGDVMLFRLGEEVKADCVIINTSLPDGLTYIETANLDGETNAKTRRAKIQTVEALGTVEDIIERSLGVPAGNAAAIFAEMNGATNGEQPWKAKVDSYGGVGAHIVTSPSQEADKALAAVGNVETAAVVPAAELETSARYVTPLGSEKHEDEKRQLLGHVTNSTSGAANSPTGAKIVHTDESHDPFPVSGVKKNYVVGNTNNNNTNSNRIRNGTRDGADSHIVVPAYLEREEREAIEAGRGQASIGQGDPFYRSRCVSGPAQLRQPLFMNTYPRTAAPHFMSSADFGGASVSGSGFGLGNVSSAMVTSGEFTLDRVWHQRHMTLDERLIEEGAIPVPQHVRELSAQYDRAVHSRTSSLGAHPSSSMRRRRMDVSMMDEAESICVEDGSGRQHRSTFSSSSILWRRGSNNNTERTPSISERGGTASLAKATLSTSCAVSGSIVTPAESGHSNNAIEQEEAADPLKAASSPQQPSSSSSGVVLVSCAPTPDLSMWFGQLRMPSGEMVPLGIEQFLPRGCLIRNTDWVLGVVVYTGRHTKMLLNLRPKPNKITNMTRRLNQLNVFLFLLNQVLMFLLCGMAIWSKHHLLRQLPGIKTEFSAWYIQWNLMQYSDVELFWWRYLTNFVLLSYLIPMSLYVTLEFNKAMQMLMIGADKRMAVYDEFTGAIKKARPKTSELNCQLGHVRYIFTDKTGTLTENLMTYVGGVVAGNVHNEAEQPGGIGRALLKRCGGGGGAHNSRCNITSNNNNNSNLSNHDNSVNGAGRARRFLAMNSGISDDLYHAENAMDNNISGALPPHSLLLPTTALSQSVTSVNGGEAPNAATYQMPLVLSNLKTPPTTINLPPSLAGLARPRSSGEVPSAAHVDGISNISPPTFAVCNGHARVGSGVGLAQLGSTAHHRGVTSGSAEQWASGTFNAFGSYSGALSGNFNAEGAGGGLGMHGGGLSSVNEAVLERDPLFRYLRALALCHSVVCFPVHGQRGVASESSESGSPNRQSEVEEGHDKDSSRTFVKLAKADQKQRKREKKAARKARKAQRKREGQNSEEARGENKPQQHHHHRSDVDIAVDQTEKGEEGRAKKSREQKYHKKTSAHEQQHHHHEVEGHITHDLAGTHSTTGAAHSRGGAVTGLPPVSTMLSLPSVSAANFVEIPYAVPAGPARNDYESFTHSVSADVAGTGINENHEPVTAAGLISRAARASHAHTGSSTSFTATAAAPPPPQQQETADSGVFQLSPHHLHKLHGRTSSASWYQNRYLNRVIHSCSISRTSSVIPRLGRIGSGGLNSTPAGRSSRILSNGTASRVTEDGVAGVSVCENLLEPFIDRTKIYEGQSLDEIALVNAARENGFSLFERTAKQMYVKALGRVMCYDIIAELEFTPQRKLMSILLQRRPDLDTEGAATLAAAGTSAHYHRQPEDNPAADQQTTNEAAVSLLYSGGETNNNGGTMANTNTNTNNNNNNSVSVYRQEVMAQLPPPAAAAHCPYASGASERAMLMNDLEKADARHTTGLSPLHKLSSHPSLLHHSPDVSRAAFQYNHSSSILASHPPPVGPQSLFSPEGAGMRSATSVGAAAAFDAHKYLLLIKGADSSMMEIVNMHKKANARVKEKMLSELDAMAQLGLRTLVLGQRYLSEEEVLAWLPVFNEAQCAMQDRNEKLHQAYALLEKDVDIVGTTAVEDKLQDEVPQTLEFCIQASIVVWMLTGDKRETAVTIAHTSGLVNPDYADYVCHLDVSDIVEEETLWKQQKQYEERVRTRRENGREGNDDDREDDEEDSDSPSPNPGGPSHSSKTTTANAASKSSATHSPGPQSARTLAGEAEGGAFHKSEPTASFEGKNGTAAFTATASTTKSESFFARKLARIEAQLAAAEEKCSEGNEVFGTHTVVVVVDGKTLDFIFADNARAHRFFILGSRCRSAVCCRMTPLQKAKIVRMFKRNMNAVALAIGDGANDVSMIQESSIGVGIMGLEGSQAELASDYAIPKFRFLKRLLFVHGRFSVFRDAHCIVFSLYKNVIVTVGMITYQFYACYSGMPLIDSWLLAMFSILFCSLQPLMIGILDKDIEDELAESLPKLYPPLSREFMYFSFPYIAKWLLDGVIEGLIFFFVLMYAVGVQDNLYPYMTPALEDYGTTFFTMLVLVADFRVGALVTYYMILFALAVSLEIICVPIIELIYSATNNLAGSNWCVKIANELYGTSCKFWMMLFFACGVLVVITTASNMYIQLFWPWQNAGFAMRSARKSSHCVPYARIKKDLKEEYVQLLARYEELRKQQEEQQQQKEVGGEDELEDDAAARAAVATSSDP